MICRPAFHPILRDLEDQAVVPPLQAGWAIRRKSNHFAAYDVIAAEFAKMIDIDPWLINPAFGRCGEVNFHERAGEECLASNIDFVLGKMRDKYREHGIEDTPYVVVKADAGTYGMGVMTVKDASEVRGLNRKQRNKMSVVKEGLEVHEVIIQEGVPTIELVDNAVAEPVVYMIDRYVVGGFYRVHTERGARREPERPGHALRAARICQQLQPPGLQRDGRGECGQPLLCLRSHRAAGAAGGGRRTRAHRASGRVGTVGSDRRCDRRLTRRYARARSRMALSLLFVVDPLDELKAYKDSSVAMMREAIGRGHRVFAATPAELAATASSVTAHAHELRVSSDNSAWYEDLGAAEHDLAEFDAVLMRKDPPFDVEFLNATLLLSRAAALGARVVNDAQALRDHNEKLSILEFPQFTVPTLVTREEERLRIFWADHEDIVVKPLDGMGGAGVFRLQRGRSECRLDPRDRDRARRTDGDGAEVHPRDSRRRQARACHRWRARAVLPGSSSESRGDAR